MKTIRDFLAKTEIKDIKIFSPAPFYLAINTPYLLPAEVIGQLLYSLYNELNYLFNFLDYQVKVQQAIPKIEQNVLHEYFSLICATPFLWKDQQDLIFFCEQEEIWKKFTYQNNTINFYFSDQKDWVVWQPKITILKEILNKLGWVDIRFALRQKKNSHNFLTPPEKKNNSFSPTPPTNKQNNHFFVPPEWKKRKLFELGIHTKFSTLDGISEATDYLKNAREKNYTALAITDHYNVQIFPEFSQGLSDDLKIIYGCELEMLEDDLPPYLFNYRSQIKEKIPDLTYCVFDLETTGFFSTYNEIIEIGYVIYQKGEIIREGTYLICPQKEISPEVLATWYTSIDPQELKKAPKISEVLPLLQKDWQNCLLVAHNARNFDYGFLNKVWKEYFKEELPYPVLDTLPLSWILFPERKSYSLQKLSHVPGRGKITQTHRALDDSKLLAELFEKLLKTLKEKKISYWDEVKELIKDGYFPNRGYKVKVLATNQVGLHNLYRLVTLSHTQRLFKKPSVFRSDLTKYRSGLLIGATGGREGEVFSLFSAFNSPRKKQEKMRFYDYIEVNSPASFRYLWLNGRIGEKELREMIRQIIRTAEELKIPVLASHNVHYCERKEKILKEILVANEGMNNSKHYLYYEATGEGQEDRFANLPTQHLLTGEEMVNSWKFLRDKNLLERLLFHYPQQIVKKIGEVSIKQPPLNYSATENVKGEEKDLIYAYTQRANEFFGEQWPDFVKKRIEKEWKIIHGRYDFIYWLAYKVVQKTQQDGYLVGSRGSIGSSFIAYLCGITDLNPLPFYKFCSSCHYVELSSTQDRIYSCYDYQDQESCPSCSNSLIMEGHNLPFETFFGWEGEKIPDIDLNFSGEYQKMAHNYVRQLLGENSVYRIGTINTLSQQTAEIFYQEHRQLRKKLNPNFSEEKWYEEWVDGEKIRELQKQLTKLRHEKIQLETELKESEKKEEK